MNEHLTEALRRIKKNSGDENVDRCVRRPSLLCAACRDRALTAARPLRQLADGS